MNMRMVFETVGSILFTLLKWMWMVVLGALRIGLELLKTILLLSGLILRLFLAFVRAGTF